MELKEELLNIIEYIHFLIPISKLYIYLINVDIFVGLLLCCVILLFN